WKPAGAADGVTWVGGPTSAGRPPAPSAHWHRHERAVQLVHRRVELDAQFLAEDRLRPPVAADGGVDLAERVVSVYQQVPRAHLQRRSGQQLLQFSDGRASVADADPRLGEVLHGAASLRFGG